MKDRQLLRKPESAHIPMISPTLHVVAMPVLVLLRHDFGYLFLRPKSIFLALIWAFGLFAIYSLSEPARWNRDPWFYGLLAASSGLYLVHLIRAMVSQWGRAPHDQFAGRPHLAPGTKETGKTFLWIEPVAVLAVAVALRFFRGENLLSDYLIVGAIALFVKEGVNQWSRIRKVKQQLDATADAEETMTKVAEERDVALKPPMSGKKKGSSRKPRQPRSRVRSREFPSERDLEEYAALLRMIPPYSREQAEGNFKALVKQLHPDEVDSMPEQNDSLAELHEAIDFFRGHPLDD